MCKNSDLYIRHFVDINCKRFQCFLGRVCQIKEDGGASIKQIGSHRGRVHKLVIEPDS
jgi:hypothetical protein